MILWNKDLTKTLQPSVCNNCRPRKCACSVRAVMNTGKCAALLALFRIGSLFALVLLVGPLIGEGRLEDSAVDTFRSTPITECSHRRTDTEPARCGSTRTS